KRICTSAPAHRVPTDFQPPGAQLNDLYLIVHSVQELKPDAYFFHRERNALELVNEGELCDEAYHLGLDQELPSGIGKCRTAADMEVLQQPSKEQILTLITCVSGNRRIEIRQCRTAAACVDVF